MLDPSFDTTTVPSPSFVVEQGAIERNLEILDRVQQRTGARILLALKGFAMFRLFPLLRTVLAGTCASSVDEAILGRQEFGGEVHTFSPAYSEESFQEVLKVSDHIIFNSPGQWRRFREQGLITAAGDRIEFGLRLNPEHSETATAIYDPCRPGSRLGIRRQEMKNIDLRGISGLHFHTLCEQDSHALERTLAAVEEKFGQFLHGMKWVNFGGGHHITRPDYDADHLCRLINEFRKRYGVEVYLEPGEAVALNAGFFVCTVLDIIEQETQIAILDASASTHLPDVLEMPYRPQIIGAGLPGERLVFTDMAHYTMVKTTTFNGIQLPAIVLANRGKVSVIRQFGYEDFKNRLS